MRHAHPSGFSLIETLVALALTASASAALLPALALSARLQRESAIETEASAIAATRLGYLEADVAAGVIGMGGTLDTPSPGWHVLIDREGADAIPAAAAFDCRWQIRPAPAPSGLRILSVSVVPVGRASAAVTISVAVPGA